MYTYRFEEHVLRMPIGSNEEEVAGRLGISAETVALIVENQAVARGRDTTAAEQCLGKLTPEQRAAVETHRVDMGKVYGPVCGRLLPNSRLIVDRFHVAKQFNDVVDDLRKKKHAEVQGELVEGPTEAVPCVDVGVSSQPEGSQARGARGVGRLVCRSACLEGSV